MDRYELYARPYGMDDGIYQESFVTLEFAKGMCNSLLAQFDYASAWVYDTHTKLIVHFDSNILRDTYKPIPTFLYV